jgi:hypothetical protein
LAEQLPLIEDGRLEASKMLLKDCLFKEENSFVVDDLTNQDVEAKD